MAGNKVGDGYIEIGADDTPLDQDLADVQRSLTRKLREAAERAGAAMIRSFTVTTARIKHKLDELTENLRAKLVVDLDTLKAWADLKILSRPRIVRLFVRVGGNAAREIAAIAKGLTGLSLIQSISRSFSNMLQNLPQLIVKFAALGSVIAAVVSPIGALAGALAPLGRSLGQILPLALAGPAAFTALGVVLGTTVAMFRGLKDSTNQAAVGFRNSLKKMRAELTALRSAMQTKFFNQFTKPFEAAVRTILPQMKSGLLGVAAAVGTLLGSGLDGLRDAFDSGNLTQFFGNLTKGLRNASKGFHDVVEALTIITLKGSELFPRMGRWFSNMGAQFSAWASSADIAGLIANAAKQFGLLWDVTKELGGVISGIFRAMETGRSTGLDSMLATLTKVHEIVDSAQFQSTLNTIFEGMAQGAEKLRAILGPVGDSFTQLAPTIAELFSTLSGTAASAINGILGALATPVAQAGIQSALAGIQTLVEGIDWTSVGAAIGSLGSLIGALAPQVGKLVNAILPHLPGILDGLTGLVAAFASMPIPLQLATVAGAGLLSTLGGLLGKLMSSEAGMALLGKAAKLLGSGLMRIVTLAIPPLLSGLSALWALMLANPIVLIVAAIAAVVAALVWFFTQTEVGRQAWGSFMTWLSGVWEATVAGAIAIWNGLGDFFTGFWAGLLAAPQAVVDWFNGVFLPGLLAIPGQIWQGFLGMVTFFFSLPGMIIGALLSLIGSMVAFWGNLITTVSTTIVSWIASFVAFWAALPGQILGAIVALATSAPQFFANLWATISSAVVSGITSVVAFFAGLPAKVIAAVSALIGLITAFWAGVWAKAVAAVTAGITNVVGFFRGLPAKVIAAISSLAGDFYAAMTKGMDRGTKATLNGVLDIAREAGRIPGKILSAIGSVGSVLFNAGSSIIEGFLRGLRSAWGAVTSFVSGIAGWIARNKGPLPYDYKLLQPAAMKIMAGFNDQLRAGMKETQRLVDAFGPGMSSEVKLATRGTTYTRGIGAGSSSTDNSTSLSIGTLAGISDPKIAEAVRLIMEVIGSSRRIERAGQPARLGV